jgi:hypothetical protein
MAEQQTHEANAKIDAFGHYPVGDRRPLYDSEFTTFIDSCWPVGEVQF